MPPWVLPGHAPWVHPVPHHLDTASAPVARGHGLVAICAMGSKYGVRNSQTALEVNLEETIWLLAAILLVCCKNQLYQKAQGT